MTEAAFKRMNAEFAVVMGSPLATATATATNLTPWACVEVTARQTRTWTASVTT